MPKQPESFVFISYASEDEQHARNLYLWLRGSGFRAWFDRESLLPGQNWQGEVQRAVHEARLVLACLSPKSVSKTGFVQRELAEALSRAREYPHGQLYLIPVLFEPCDVPEPLRHLQWVDLRSSDGYERLLSALRRVLGEPSLSNLRVRAEAVFNWYLLRVVVLDRKTRNPLPGVAVELNEVRARHHNRFRNDHPLVGQLLYIKRFVVSAKGTTDRNGQVYFAVSDQILVAPEACLVVSAAGQGYAAAHVESEWLPGIVLRKLEILVSSPAALCLASDEVADRIPNEEIIIELAFVGSGATQ
jgi:hypothetical protein